MIAKDNGLVEQFHVIKINREKIGADFLPKTLFATHFVESGLKNKLT